MQTADELIARVKLVQHGFTDIKKAASEVISDRPASDCLTLADQLFASEIPQARMLATFIFGYLSPNHPDCFTFLKNTVSLDPDWRVQEILAQAFDHYCQSIGYETALPAIEGWLTAENPNLRRAASEGLRIWTARPYFREHPERAIHLLSQCKADSSEYVRKSIGNALRDISRSHAPLIQAELVGWDISDKKVAQTHKLASKFLA